MTPARGVTTMAVVIRGNELLIEYLGAIPNPTSALARGSGLPERCCRDVGPHLKTCPYSVRSTRWSFRAAPGAGSPRPFAWSGLITCPSASGLSSGMLARR